MAEARGSITRLRNAVSAGSSSPLLPLAAEARDAPVTSSRPPQRANTTPRQTRSAPVRRAATLPILTAMPIPCSSRARPDRTSSATGSPRRRSFPRRGGRRGTRAGSRRRARATARTRPGGRQISGLSGPELAPPESSNCPTTSSTRCTETVCQASRWLLTTSARTRARRPAPRRRSIPPDRSPIPWSAANP